MRLARAERPWHGLEVHVTAAGGGWCLLLLRLLGDHCLGGEEETGEYVDMFKAGIIDPAKVTRSALQNAASIAGLFLTTEAVIAEKPEKEKAPAAPGGGDMDF